MGRGISMSEPSLEYFIAIAEERNISRAAEKLHISQQSLSTYLQKLEAHYKSTLLIRKPNMHLTEAGEIVYQGAMRIQRMQQGIKNDLWRLNARQEQLSIGIFMPNASLLTEFIPLIEFSRKYPTISYNVAEDINGALRDKLKDGTLDLIISAYENDQEFPDFVVRKLYVNTDYIVISDALLRQYFPDNYDEVVERFSDGAKLREFSHIPVLVPPKHTGFAKRIMRYCQENDVTLNIAGEISNRFLSDSMIFDSIAWGFSDRRYLTYMESTMHVKELHKLRAFPIVDPVISASVGVMYQKKDSYPNYFLDLVNMIVEKNTYLA